MKTKLSTIKIGLKHVHDIFAGKEYIQEHNFKKYLNGLLSWRKPKIKFNKSIFIKSLLSNLENKKINFLIDDNSQYRKNMKINTIQIKKNENKNNIKNKFPRLRKSQSCIELYDEKNILINNSIKSNNKFNAEFLDENVKTQDLDNSPFFKSQNRKENINLNILKSFRIINPIKNNYPLKIQKNSRSFINSSNKYLINKRPNSSRVMKISQGSQSTIDMDLDRYKRNNLNKLKIKQRLKFEDLYYRQIEYLKFLEKKSLSLRANFIVNNIQEKRGGKQELRASYNPQDR